MRRRETETIPIPTPKIHKLKPLHWRAVRNCSENRKKSKWNYWNRVQKRYLYPSNRGITFFFSELTFVESGLMQLHLNRPLSLSLLSYLLFPSFHSQSKIQRPNPPLTCSQSIVKLKLEFPKKQWDSELVFGFWTQNAQQGSRWTEEPNWAYTGTGNWEIESVTNLPLPLPWLQV